MPEFQHGNEGRRDTLIVTQPPHFPTMHTRETVTHLAAFGLDEKQVAVILRCTPDDVTRYYSEEMEHGLTRINAQVMSAVLHAALYEDSAADRKLWLTNKAGWRGDGNNRLQLPNPNDPNATSDGVMTIVQRREVITRVLTNVTRDKRQRERVIEGELVEAKKTDGSNGHDRQNGTNGSGNGKHR